MQPFGFRKKTVNVLIRRILECRLDATAKGRSLIPLSARKSIETQHDLDEGCDEECIDRTGPHDMVNWKPAPHFASYLEDLTIR